MKIMLNLPNSVLNLQTLPTDLWVKIVQERMKLFDCIRKGWVMEGFPQTREQAIALQAAGITPKHCGGYKFFFTTCNPILSDRQTS